MKCVLDIFFLLPFSPLEGQMLRKQRGGIQYRLYPVIHGKEYGDRGPRLCRSDQFHQRPVSVRTGSTDSHHGYAGCDIQPRDFVGKLFPYVEGSR
jgi:hypothetical protein